ncbi:MAG: sialate O-acetylesterase [bacterium]
MRVMAGICTCTAICLIAVGQVTGEQSPAKVDAATGSSVIKGRGKGPVKVFILAGQSNMDGQADIKTIDYLGEDKKYGFLLKTFKPDGKNFVKREDVWVSYWDVNDILQTGFGGRKDYSKLGNRIGPEYGFGYYMGEALDEQVLLIKHGPGGQSLGINFRPPSAGVPPGKKPEDVGGQYRALVGLVNDTLKNLKKNFPDYDEKAGYEIVGFVWFQGYNDLGTSKRGVRKESRLPD